MIKHIDKSGFKDKLLNNNKEKSQKIIDYNTSFVDNRKNRKSQSIKAIDNVDINGKIRSISYLNTENNENTNDYNSFSRSLNNSKIKEKTKIVKILNESKNTVFNIPKGELNENFAKNYKKVNNILVKNSDNSNILKSLNNITSSLDCLKTNGNTIINIYNKNLKEINNKTLKKSSDFQKNEIIKNDFAKIKIPRHITNTNTNNICSSLIEVNRSRTRTNFDKKIIKNDSTQFEDKKISLKKDRNEDISLSYSDDEKLNKQNNIKNLFSDDKYENPREIPLIFVNNKLILEQNILLLNKFPN